MLLYFQLNGVVFLFRGFGGIGVEAYLGQNECVGGTLYTDLNGVGFPKSTFGIEGAAITQAHFHGLRFLIGLPGAELQVHGGVPGPHALDVFGTATVFHLGERQGTCRRQGHGFLVVNDLLFLLFVDGIVGASEQRNADSEY